MNFGYVMPWDPVRFYKILLINNLFTSYYLINYNFGMCDLAQR